MKLGARLSDHQRRIARWVQIGIPTALILGALPASAGAADYCVAPNTACGATNVATLEQALDLADNAPDADRVLLGATTYLASGATGFYYSESGSPVEIVGQGRGQTILTAPSAASFVLRLVGGAGSSVHDLTIRVPQNAAGGLKGLSTANAGRRIEVVEDTTQANKRYGVELVNGGTLEDSSVTLGSAQESTGVLFESGGGSLLRSAVSARVGVWSEYGGTVERSRLTGSEVGLAAYRGMTSVSSSVVRFTNGFGAGIVGLTRFGFQTSVKADGVTIVGPGLPNTFGAYAGTGLVTGAPVSIGLTNSIIRGVSAALYAYAGGAGQATVAASYSDYDPSGNMTSGDHGGDTSISEANVSNLGDARFANAAAGDYRLLPGSPLLDTGDPATPQGLDLDGGVLVADGNGDGSARRDLGAYELQPSAGAQPAVESGQQGAAPAMDTRPPLVTGFKVGPSVFAVARAATPLAARVPRGTRFRYSLSEAARVSLTIRRASEGRFRTVGRLKRNGVKGTNRVRFSGRIGRRALRPGRYRAVITATDAAGNRSTPKRARFRVGTP